MGTAFRTRARRRRLLAGVAPAALFFVWGLACQVPAREPAESAPVGSAPIATQTSAKPFAFVQLCDPQIAKKSLRTDTENLIQAARQIQALEPRPAFVLICGDLVDVHSTATQAALDQGLAAFEIPVHVVPGNHDVIAPVRASSLKFFRKRHGSDTFSFVHEGVRFVGVNNQFWFPQVRARDGALLGEATPAMIEEGRLHDDWLETQLREAKQMGQPSFVMGHYPLFLETPEDKVYFRGLMRNTPLPKRKSVLELFRKTGVVAYLSGHVHANYVTEADGIVHVSSARPGINIQKGRNQDGSPLVDPPGFRLWSVTPNADGVAFEHQYLPLQPSRLR